MKLTVGAQLYTVREFTKTPDDIRRTFKKVAAMGYTSVQASGMGKIDPCELRDIAAENGLKIIITHTDPQRVLSDTERVISEHKVFGCGMVGIGARPARYADNTGGYRAFIQDFDVAAKKLQDSGMKLHYHNHEFEFARHGGQVLYDLLINETDPARWAFIPDVFWVQAGGRNPARQLKDLKGRCDVCHFKDYKVEGSERYMAAVGEGNLHWDEIIAACADAGIKYAMVEQDDCYGEDPFALLERSCINLRNMLRQ